MEDKRYIYQCEVSTSIGPKLINQDNFTINDFVHNEKTVDALTFKVTLAESEDCHIAAVADGVTNSAFGEKASKTVRDTIVDAFEEGAFHSLDALSTKFFDDLMIKAAKRMAEERCIKGYGRNGATTVSMTVFNEQKIVTYNCGDSPIFMVRGDKILPMFVEDSLGAEKERYNNTLNRIERLYKKESITPSDYHVLTKCVSTNRNHKVHGHSFLEYWQNGDVLLLCSDGLTDVVSEDDIIRISKEDDAAKKLTELAYKKELKDNVTVIIIKRQVVSND